MVEQRHGKQNYKCRDCGRQFVEDPQWRPISDEIKGIVDRLLLEKISHSRYCPCLTNFRIVVTAIRKSKVQDDAPGGASAPKAEASPDSADG